MSGRKKDSRIFTILGILRICYFFVRMYSYACHTNVNNQIKEVPNNESSSDIDTDDDLEMADGVNE